MPIIPAIITGMMLRMTSLGLNTPMEAMPTPDLAVPYADPRFANTSDATTPMKPKNDAELGHTLLTMK